MSKNRTHLDDFAKLLKKPPHNLSIDVYNEDKKIKRKPTVTKPKPKYTLDQIGDALFGFIKTTNERFDKIETRLDNIEKRLDRVETRLDHVEKRLDYIVKVNDLKDLPK